MLDLRETLIWPFFDLKMRKNGFVFRNLGAKLGKRYYGNFFLPYRYGCKFGFETVSNPDSLEN
jgi:hypothetical protein